MNLLKELLNLEPVAWIKAHPFKAIGFTSVWTFLACILGTTNASVGVSALVYGVPTVFWLWVAWRDHRKTL